MSVIRVTRYLSTLRDYQHACIQESLKNFKDGLKRVAVSLPVGNVISEVLGSGKTKIGIEQGTRKADKDCQVLIASVATLGRNRSERLERYNPDEFKCIIIDEAHHATASTYQRILEYFKVYDNDSHIKLWGCSATLRRHDGLSLAPTFEKVIYQLPVLDLISMGHLCDLSIKTIKTNLNLGKIATLNGDFNLAQLSASVDTSIRNQIVVATYLDQLETHRMKSTLVFAVNIQHIQNLVAEFVNNGIEAVGIHSCTTQDDREKILYDFKEQKIPVLINCGIITEGVDIPNIDCLLMARPTKSGVLLQQMLGRGMRLHPGKESCLVLDFVDTIDSSMMVATIPTLLGLDPSYVMNEKLSSKARQLNSSKDPNKILTDSSAYSLDEVTVTLIPFDNPFAVNSVQQDSAFIKKYSKLSWVRTGMEKWVIFVYPADETVILERGPDGLFNGYSRMVRRGQRTKEMQILKHDNFESAVRGLDQYIIEKAGYTFSENMSWTANWRKLEMTPKQTELMRKYGVSGELNRGIAADIITKSRHGVKGYLKKQARRDKVSQKAELERQKLSII
ncbi:hypothetical protein HDV06_001634 [Boothiomyces sp. JEL0866]|nr:hypothetical protein HDV06_001634 [Boothiomyces sp. JEL0866]